MNITDALDLFVGLAPLVLMPTLLILLVVALLRWVGLLSEGAFTQVVVILAGVASSGTFIAGATFEETFIGLLTAFFSALAHRLLTEGLPALTKALTKSKNVPSA